jgi:hypothetical protein
MQRTSRPLLHLPAGVYLLRVETPEGVLTRQLALVR